MIIEVLPNGNCADCVFCEELVFCKLMNGEPIDYDYENGREIASFCPLVNPNTVNKITDKVKVIKG